jgi:two-component system cell cycle sensor histidine kinase/response regulator CckA
MSTQTLQELALIAAMADRLPDGILVASVPSGAVAYANRAFHEIFGPPPPRPAQAGSAAPSYVIHRRDGALYPEDELPLARALRTKASVVADDLVVHRADGSRAFIRALARPLLDPADAITHVVVVFTDITAEVQARARADLVENRLRLVLAKAPLILFAFDRHGLVTLSEGRGLEGLGFRSSELLGRSVFELYANDPVSLANAHRVLAGEEFRVTSYLGSVALETVFTPLRDPKGNVQGAIGVSIDVSDREMMHRRLLQSERLASTGTLSATIAHEINNPLTYVLGNLELLAKRLGESVDIPTAKALAHLVNQAREGADRVRRIVRGLQAFSRQDDGRAEATDVHGVLRHALEMTDNEIRHRARVVLRLDPVPPVVGNNLRLCQVFVNLLVNAAQAIPEGHADANEIRVVVKYDDAEKMVTVLVADTGKGIPPAIQSRIFEPLFTTKPIGEGTGLGLSICYGIVSGFGGRIEVDSVPGRGSSFCVFLRASEGVRAGDPIAVSAGAASRPGRILIIDDDEQVARSLEHLLAASHDVEVSLDPKAIAERLLAGERFDVIFCDLMMPSITGMELHALLANKTPEQAKRIVFVTGGAFTPAARAFASSTENILLEKPFDLAALEAALAHHLS